MITKKEIFFFKKIFKKNLNYSDVDKLDKKMEKYLNNIEKKCI